MALKETIGHIANVANRKIIRSRRSFDLDDHSISTIISHTYSYRKPVIRLILPDKFIYEYDVDSLLEVSLVVVYRELISTLLLLSSS
jgi:hypothetical protein